MKSKPDTAPLFTAIYGGMSIATASPKNV